MIERRSGKIIILSGGGAGQGRPNFSAYAGSKIALARIVECIGEEIRDHNVQINCLLPGGAYTSMTDEILQAADRAGAREIEEAHRIRITGGIPAEKQIQLALFLASDKSNHITGKLIHVTDDWKKLEHENMKQEAYTVRRLR
jgi:3-oxoacyl-[acyl-carrier protein] reductase